MQKFDVVEQDKTEFTQRFPTVKFLHGEATKFNSDNHVVFYRSFELSTNSVGSEEVSLRYRKLCVCTGGEPNGVVPKLDCG